jgi:hypothetical protein
MIPRTDGRRTRTNGRIKFTEDGRAYPTWMENGELDDAIHRLHSHLTFWLLFRPDYTDSEQDFDSFIDNLASMNHLILDLADRYRGARHLERLCSCPPPAMPE